MGSDFVQSLAYFFTVLGFFAVMGEEFSLALCLFVIAFAVRERY